MFNHLPDIHQKRSSVVAYFRQLCFGGVASEIVAPELVKTILAIVPAQAVCVVWHHPETGRCLNLFTHGFDTPLLEQAAAHWELVTAPGEPTPNNWKNGHQAGALLDMPRRTFEKSHVWRLLLKPAGLKYVLDARVGDADLRPLMSITLHRASNAREFTRKDAERLNDLLPYLRHLLLSEMDHDIGFEPVDIGPILMDLQGRVLAQSPQAEELLAKRWLPSVLHGAPDGGRTEGGLCSGTLLTRLLRIVGRATTRKRPRSLVIPVPGGRLVFEGRLLRGDGRQLVSALIRFEESLAHRALKRVGTLPLTPLHREIAYRIGLNWSTGMLLEQFNLRKSTMRSYLTQIFSNVGVKDRRELAHELTASMAVDRTSRRYVHFLRALSPPVNGG